MRCRIANHLLLFYHYKVAKVFGISSKVPNSEEHYLLFDVDKPLTDTDVLEWFMLKYAKEGGHRCTIYQTHNGFHLFVWKAMPWREVLAELILCPHVDLNWVALGIKRGYFFLQNYRHVRAPKDVKVTYMKVDRIA